ncbi:hypothetical protein ABKV19_026507 [Rosa sericea]
MVMAHGSFFVFLIFFSSFISTNNILHACASIRAQRNSFGLSSPPSNRISIHCGPRREGITKCNHNDLATLTSYNPDTPVGGIIANNHV